MQHSPLNIICLLSQDQGDPSKRHSNQFVISGKSYEKMK